MARKMTVNLSVSAAADAIEQAIYGGSMSAELVNRYESSGEDGARVVSMMFQKYYWRAGNYAALSVTVENLSGVTRVNAVSAGAKQGLLSFDWGAGSDFEDEVLRALEKA